MHYKGNNLHSKTKSESIQFSRWWNSPHNIGASAWEPGNKRLDMAFYDFCMMAQEA